MNPILSNHDIARLEALRQYQILDTSPEQAFDDLAFLAAQVCGTLIALINFIDSKRQWFKAKVGIDLEEMPIDIGFCFLCLEHYDIVIIPDTLAEEQFATSYVVTCAPHIRFYAGVPLITPEGYAIGTLCVIDLVPRQLKPEQVESLKAISRLVMRQLELRRNLMEVASIKKEYQKAQEALRQSESHLSTFISQKKQLEKQFLRAQRMESIGTLASGIAHDLNNVLSPILMSVQVIKNKCHDERSQQILTIVENNAKRGANLVKQVLSFARGIEGDRTVLEVKHLIAEMKQIVEQTFPKSIVVETEIQPNLLTICGDSTQLHQVLINLCLNARDAMPKGGTLKISAKNVFIDENYAKKHLDARVGCFIVLSVSDTGIGIPNELVDRIFEPFFTTKEIGKGTGLGLSTVMGIIKGHGGFITVSSSQDKGTEFQVYIPAVNTEAKQAPEILKNVKGQGEWILVVDDEAGIREITKASLENNNYKVITASDGREAVAIYTQYKEQISVVIIDMMMPNMDGAATLKALQKLTSSLRIITVSGFGTPEQLPFEKSLALTTFLPKPYTTQELLKTLHTVICKH